MKKKLSIATWNVRTLLDLKDADRPQRQTALVARELDRYNIDIAALQETRLEGQGTLQENNHTFFWIGKEPGIRREVGVGFTIANSLVKQHPTYYTDWYIRMSHHPQKTYRENPLCYRYQCLCTDYDKSRSSKGRIIRTTVSNTPKGPIY